MTIRPLQDRILVKRVQEEEKTKGGLFIPDSAKEKPVEGEIVAIGNGKVLEDGKVRPLDVKVGDRVLFSKYGGTEVKLDGEEHLIMREDEVLQNPHIRPAAGHVGVECLRGLGIDRWRVDADQHHAPRRQQLHRLRCERAEA